MFRITPVVQSLAVRFVLEKRLPGPDVWLYVTTTASWDEAMLWAQVETIYQEVGNRDYHV